MRLNEILDADSTVEDMDILGRQPFEITTDDLELVYRIGEKAREVDGEDNISAESTVFLNYLVHKLRKNGIPEIAAEMFTEIIPFCKEYCCNRKADREAAKKYELRIMNRLKRMRKGVGDMLPDVNATLWATMKDVHYKSVAAHDMLEDREVSTYMNHYMNNTLCILECLYYRAIPEYDDV